MLPPPHDPLAFKDESSSTEIKKENTSLVKIQVWSTKGCLRHMSEYIY
jgi:hypothetical protein